MAGRWKLSMPHAKLKAGQSEGKCSSMPLPALSRIIHPQKTAQMRRSFLIFCSGVWGASPMLTNAPDLSSFFSSLAKGGLPHDCSRP